jgi:two-component system nitrogen regulation response regulator GlnG
VSNAVPQDVGISQYLETKLRAYFLALEETPQCAGLYDQIIAEVERPLLTLTLEFCNGNKVKAADMLGMNRNTLSKKLKSFSGIR